MNERKNYKRIYYCPPTKKYSLIFYFVVWYYQTRYCEKECQKMGIYLNSADALSLYKSETIKPYFVDKSNMLEQLFPLGEEGSNYICITRPRRFGKTIMANMIGAFFSNAADSKDVFDKLKIASSTNYLRHLNQHDVIYIDFSEIDDECRNYTS